MDADFDGFLEKVSEATRLVEGLKEGKINPEYVDKITQADAEKKRKEQEKVEAEERERADPERQARLQAKVEEIKANMERKRRARERYEARQAEKRAAQGGAVRAGGPTDYESWDLWTPSDEEDELVNSMLPQGAEFKAMEKDIEERHKRMTEARQAAERARVRGNAEFKRGNWAGAYQEYCDGLAREKTNMALHGNAAMAAIKRGCFVQAVDHCDRVVHLAEFLHERPRDPLVVKAYQRRATARSALGHLREAVADLEKAVEIEPGNAEAAGQLARAREVLAEDQRARRAAAAARGEAGADDAALDAQAAQEMRMLRELERLAGAVRGSAGPVTSAFDPLSKGKGGGRRGGGAQDVSDVLAELAKLVRESEACRVHVRACGGLEAVSDWTRAQLEGGGCAPGLRCLEAASYNDFNGEWLQEHGVLDSVARALPGLLAGARADAESGLQLLLTSSTAPAVRQAVSAALAAGDGAPALTAVLAAAASTTKANATAALALALLAQTAVDAPVRAAIAARTTQLAAALARWLDAPKGGAARDWPQAERAAACAGNVLGDAVVRGAVARSSALPAALARLAAAWGPSSAGAQTSATSAALAALGNVAVEAAAVAALGDDEALMRWIPGAIRACAMGVTPRAALLASRVARSEAGLGAMVDAGLWDACEEALRCSPDSVDAVARTCAIAAAGGGVGRRSLAAHEGMLAALVGVLSTAKASEAAAGNAALALGDVAADPAGLEAARRHGAVAPLVEAMVRRGGHAQKNAAIACAKLAQDAGLRKQLQDLNGVEIMMRYVRP